ncbi:2-phosphosulfolactate phosphatase [Actinoplanes sp. NPDC023714]|uniref:2-phosphosulfolactate phosphatase n=1 Tax=Actinoplanes sp. NPDC023714 TaxID=3154322 RepID=UPI0033E69E5C
MVFSQSSYDLRFDWGLSGAAAIAPGAFVVAVVDVLSFTTALTVAAENGTAVLPHRWRDPSAADAARRHNAALAVGRSQARRLSQPVPAPSPGGGPRSQPVPAPSPGGGPRSQPLPASLPGGGPRSQPLPASSPDGGPGSQPVPAPSPGGGPRSQAGASSGPGADSQAGGDPQPTHGEVSLSPATIAAASHLERLILPSPNGSTISAALAETGATVVGVSLRNASAAAAWVRTRAAGRPIAVVAAGERWPDGNLRPAIEDLWGAGAFLHHLTTPLGPRISHSSPEAAVAIAAYQAAAPTLPSLLAETASGRELTANGYPEDVSVAAAVNTSHAVPLLIEGWFRPAT